jgi:uncharacterized protein (DUF1015 family)
MPDFACTDDYGAQHRVWRVTDPATIAAIQAAMNPLDLYIADGHHRHATAIADYQRRKAAGEKLHPDANARMATFVNMHDPGLVILPTHRLAGSVSKSWDALWSSLSRYFSLREVELPGDAVGRANAISGLLGAMREAPTTHRAFGIVSADRSQPLRLITRNDTPVPGASGKSPVETLDVWLLHRLVIEQGLGIDAARVAAEAIEYRRDAVAAIEETQAADSKFEWCFLLNPTRLSEVRDVSHAGEVMPQKSTDFYPKLLSGLLIQDVNL